MRWRTVLCGALCGGLLAASDAGDAGDGQPKTITTKTGVAMVLVPGGAFMMGSTDGKPDEQPAHKVTLSAFYMDTCEVRQKDFEKMTGMNPSKFGGEGNPVEQIRWFEAVEYCNARSEREGLDPCYDVETGACNFEANGYRLPTEAEWEYACRAGTATPYFFGDSPAKLTFFGWFKDNAAKRAHPVGEKKPNAFGLYDMAGNLWEWCNDFYAEDYYSTSPEQDPRGPAAGKKKVLRGGCWATGPETCTSSRRHADAPELADVCLGYDVYGFRCVRKP
ncbi:MAG: formylglycine-generating enzyme family protein [Kiritimatiellae bacterium]|nr:formylglycine-generating enzyme family protein [Kiritimatiellia bacterium]